MLLPSRSYSDGNCPPSTDACDTTLAIVGADPTEKETNDDQTLRPASYDKPGAHRYIGIAMVMGLLLIAFGLWLYLGKWPKRKMRDYGCCGSRREESPESAGELTRPSSPALKPPDLEKEFSAKKQKAKSSKRQSRTPRTPDIQLSSRKEVQYMVDMVDWEHARAHGTYKEGKVSTLNSDTLH